MKKINSISYAKRLVKQHLSKYQELVDAVRKVKATNVTYGYIQLLKLCLEDTVNLIAKTDHLIIHSDFIDHYIQLKHIAEQLEKYISRTQRTWNKVQLERIYRQYN